MQLSQTPMIEMKVVPIKRPYAQTLWAKMPNFKNTFSERSYEPEYGPGHTSRAKVSCAAQKLCVMLCAEQSLRINDTVTLVGGRLSADWQHVSTMNGLLFEV